MFPFSDILFENTQMYSYFAQIFSSETKIVIFICKLCLQTARRVCKIQRTVCEYVNILFNQVYEKVIFSKTEYMIGVGFTKAGSQTRTKITPKLPPPPPTRCIYRTYEIQKNPSYVIGSIYCKRPRLDCFLRISLLKVHSVCFHVKYT